MLTVFSLGLASKILLGTNNSLERVNGGETQPMLRPRGKWPGTGQLHWPLLPQDTQARLGQLIKPNETSESSDAERRCWAATIKDLEYASEALACDVDEEYSAVSLVFNHSHGEQKDLCISYL